MNQKGSIRLLDLILLFGAVIIFGIASFFIYVQLSAFIQTQNKVTQATQELQVLHDQYQVLLKIKADAPLYEQKFAQIDQKIPSNAEQGSLISYIQSEAVQTNIQFTQMQFDTQIPQKGYIQIPMKISFVGDYIELTNLLDRLSKGSRGIRVDDVTMTKNDPQSVSKVKAEITAIAFYMPAIP